MPKKTEYPGLRVHRWKARDGSPQEAYYFDMRGKGKDRPLGTDRERAIAGWRILRAGGDFDPFPMKRPPPPPANVPMNHIGPLVVGSRRKLPENIWDGCPKWAKRMYLAAEKRSKDAGRKAGFLSIEDFRDVVTAASGHCQLTGIPFDESAVVNGKRRPFGPSIDRIDSRFGYTRGNVRIVCLLANQALGDWGDEPVIEFAKAVVRKFTSATLRESADANHLQLS